MPVGTPDYGFIAPFPIRVDAFHTPRDAMFSPPALYLLTHTHSDHTVGLSNKSFSSRIVCSPDARQMLLAMEPAADRIAVDNGSKALRNRPFAHLKVDPVTREDGRVDHSLSRDLLLPIPLNTPRMFELNDKHCVTITLIDANHCLGAVMFLVESDTSAILHTGDFRAESTFLSSLYMNCALQRYLAPKFCFSDSQAGPTRTLDAIYLDTACMLRTHSVPTKAAATEGLVQLMSLFPPETRFFLNCWTWGYEDMLKAVACAFRTKIHVDRYKYTIFMKTSDPFLKALVSLDEKVSRFHACERHDRCNQINFPPNTESIVYVNPIDLSVQQWSTYLTETRAEIEAGKVLTNLIVPLARHSPLPELQEFVRMFRPKTVVPNTLDPALHGVDYAAMIAMFEDCLAPGGAAVMKDQMLSERISMGPSSLSRRQKADAPEPRDGLMAQLDNIVGAPGVEENASHWACSEGGPNRRMEVLKSFLPETLIPALGRVFGAKRAPAIRARDGTDYETTDDEQSHVASLDFEFSSSPLAGKSQRRKALGSMSPTPEAPTTPSALKRQRSLPDVSPTATPKGPQRGKRDGHMSTALGLLKPERTHSESHVHPLRTPLSSPSRPLKRKLPHLEQLPVQHGKTKRIKSLKSKQTPLFQRVSPVHADADPQHLQKIDSSKTLFPTEDGAKDPKRNGRQESKMPVVSRLSGHRASARPSDIMPRAGGSEHCSQGEIKLVARPRGSPKRPRSCVSTSINEDDNLPLNTGSLHRRKNSEQDYSSDSSTSVVPDSQESSISTVSAVLRRTHTVTRTEALIIPVAVDATNKNRQRKQEQTRHTLELRHAQPDATLGKRIKTHVGNSDDARKLHNTTVHSEDATSSFSRRFGRRGIATVSDQSKSKFKPSEQHETGLTPLNMHANEPFGLEVTFPRVGFAFRDSQGNMSIDDFDYDY